MKIKTDKEIHLENVANEAKDAAAFKALKAERRYWIGDKLLYEERIELREDCFGHLRQERVARPVIFEASHDTAMLLGVYAVSGASIAEAIQRFAIQPGAARKVRSLGWSLNPEPLTSEFIVKRVLLFEGVTV